MAHDKSRPLAEHLESRGDLTCAKRAILEALVVAHLEAHGGDVEKSLAAVPARNSTRGILVKLVGALWRRRMTLRNLGDPAGEAAGVRLAVRLCEQLPPSFIRYSFEKARSHAALAGLAGRAGSGVSAAEGEIEAARAREWLGRAVAVGYRNANELRFESALDPLRSRQDFRLLMMDLALPADPFARGR